MVNDLRQYFLFVGTIFLSAFLLFTVQPMISKMLLPWFGGSSSVWGATLLFFTGFLFVGYVYVYVLTQKDAAIQKRIHTWLVGAAGVILVMAFALNTSAFDRFSWILSSSLPPFFEVLLALIGSIGLPYFVLATTAPLLQHWYGATNDKEPYWLYAISNFGSFVALGGYVFLVSPNIPLFTQELLWVGGFVAYALLALYITRTLTRAPALTASSEQVFTSSSLFRKDALVWVALSALPAFLLIATTTKITQVIAPIPLLWVLPLALYLATFIVAFGGYTSRWVTIPLATLATWLAFTELGAGAIFINEQTFFFLLFLFAVSLLCHGALYESRPHQSGLARFYLFISLGGVIGVFLGSVIPALILNSYKEFEIGIVLAALTIIVLIPAHFFSEKSKPVVRLYAKVLLGVVILSFAISFARDADYTGLIYQTRNFYGVASVYAFEEDEVMVHYLYQGETLHGMQFMDPSFSRVATTYYSPTGGAGIALAQMRRARDGGPLRVGVVGLGTGTLASYCEEGDYFTFFEIDGRMVNIARESFTYLEACSRVDVREGDARILLEDARQKDGPFEFDVLAIDAFTDDTIPTHLITREAIELFFDHTAPDGLIAMHTSNRYLDLAPVVLRTAQEKGYTAIVYDNQLYGQDFGGSASEWVLLAREESAFREDWREYSNGVLEVSNAKVWSDQHADVLSSLYFSVDPQNFIANIANRLVRKFTFTRDETQDESGAHLESESATSTPDVPVSQK